LGVLFLTLGGIAFAVLHARAKRNKFFGRKIMKTRSYNRLSKVMWTLAIGAMTAVFAGAAPAQDHQDRMDMSPDDSAVHMKEAQMLINTLSEEKTEINALAVQAMKFKQMGGSRNMKIASLLNRMIRDHKAGGPKLMMLIKKHGGDPMSAKILKAPVLGSEMEMLHADMADHMKAEMTSQMRHNMTGDRAVKTAMHKRAGVARKHMMWMKKYHKMSDCPMCADMMKGMKMKGDMKMKDDMEMSGDVG